MAIKAIAECCPDSPSLTFVAMMIPFLFFDGFFKCFLGFFFVIKEFSYCVSLVSSISETSYLLPRLLNIFTKRALIFNTDFLNIIFIPFFLSYTVERLGSSLCVLAVHRLCRTRIPLISIAYYSSPVVLSASEGNILWQLHPSIFVHRNQFYAATDLKDFGCLF